MQDFYNQNLLFYKSLQVIFQEDQNLKNRVIKASSQDTAQIVSLLKQMSDELQELSFDTETVEKSVQNSFDEGVHWFLFQSDEGDIFGGCYLQSVHNYWRLERRFYLGGFYIDPNFRGRGFFKEINLALKKWAEENGGVQIYTHIHKDNEKSQQAFLANGMEETEYRLFANHWGS